MLSTSADSFARPRILQLRQTTLFVTRNIPTPLRSNIRKLFPRNSLSNSRILSYSRVASNCRPEKRIWRPSMNFPSFFLCLGFKVPIGKLFISPSDKSTRTPAMRISWRNCSVKNKTRNQCFGRGFFHLDSSPFPCKIYVFARLSIPGNWRALVIAIYYNAINQHLARCFPPKNVAARTCIAPDRFSPPIIST